MQIAKKELEALVSGQDESSVSKMTTTLAQEMEERAIPLGMPKPLSDRERPSLHTLGKVQSNFSPGGQYLPLAVGDVHRPRDGGSIAASWQAAQRQIRSYPEGREAHHCAEGHGDQQHGECERCHRHEGSLGVEGPSLCHAERLWFRGLSAAG